MTTTNTTAAERRESKLDSTLDDTFPASDPPSMTPLGGTRKSAELADAHAQDAAPAGLPTSDRHATETAAARQHGVHPAETDDHSGGA